MVKNCKNCGEVFAKNYYYSKTYWATQKFCSRKCVAISKRGIKQSVESRLKHSISLKKYYSLHPERAQKSSEYMKYLHSLGRLFAHGKHWRKTEGQLQNKMGVKNPAWKGGITPINTKIRNSTQYADWRVSVFERDNYACQMCGDRSAVGNPVILHADHIKPFAYFPELRFELSNGRTLCKPCHAMTDTYAGRAKVIQL